MNEIKNSRSAQSELNDHKCASWILNLLNDNVPVSELSVQVSTELLNNLCVRSRARFECSSSPRLILTVINRMVENDNLQVRTFLNGILFSLLSNTPLREYVRSMGMMEQLQYMKQLSDERAVKQLDHVLNKLKIGKFYL